MCDSVLVIISIIIDRMNVDSEKSWDDIAQKAAKIKDKLGMPIDKGIFDAVVVVNMLGFNTSGSCEGHIGRATGGPYVVFESKEAQAYVKKARERLLEADYRDKEYLRLRGLANEYTAKEMYRMMGYLEAFYTDRKVPFKDRIIIASFPMTYLCIKCQGADAALAFEDRERQELLRSSQEEMSRFVEFLKQKHLS